MVALFRSANARRRPSVQKPTKLCKRLRNFVRCARRPGAAARNRRGIASVNQDTPDISPPLWGWREDVRVFVAGHLFLVRLCPACPANKISLSVCFIFSLTKTQNGNVRPCPAHFLVCKNSRTNPFRVVVRHVRPTRSCYGSNIRSRVMPFLCSFSSISPSF
jgi:hypothetical protein